MTVADTSPAVRSGVAPVALAGLTKRFGGDVLAVDRLTLTVGAGQVFGLLGPNGAGKTTTLRMLLGLVHPSAGSLRVFGEPVRPGAPVLSRVGALVESPGFVPHRSGRDNLQLYWRAGGRPLSEAHLDQALALADLGPAVDRPYKTYSHGMRQRLALAQAMLGQPELVVLDEPTSGLDPQQMREVREAIRRLAAHQVTVLLSSHLLSEVEQVCTHAAVMDRGRLVAAGTVAELTGSTAGVYVEVDDVARASELLSAVPGVTGVTADPPGLHVQLHRVDVATVVAALVHGGVGVRQVVGRRRLEDAFIALLEAERT